jgi:hypothetical protein
MAPGVGILKSQHDAERRQIADVRMIQNISDSPLNTSVNPHGIRMIHNALKKTVPATEDRKI